MSETLTELELRAAVPTRREVTAADVDARLTGARKVVVIDDDPTGTQTTAGLPVLTAWGIEDVRWAMSQDLPGFFILTNSRSLAPADAARVTAEVARVCTEAARLEGVDHVFASRGDSTLRGHFPLETDVLVAELAADGVVVDGVVLAPAYIDAGRVTVDGVHLVRRGDLLTPVGESEFAADATFGYRSSDLRGWVQEKTGGAIPADQVRTISLADLRAEGGTAVTAMLSSLHSAQVVAVDALDDDDLRALALGVLDAEARGGRFVYRVGPSFVRARLGQDASAPLTGTELESILAAGVDGIRHGLIVVGSHTALTTSQLTRLRQTVPVSDLEVDVNLLRDERTREETISGLVEALADELTRNSVVLSTSRVLVTGADGAESLAFARLVSESLVAVVRAVRERVRPAFVVAKGGITSSDIATEALGIVRAIARGTLLPGIVSLWQPLGGRADGIPYIVFAGNVGEESSLADVVRALVAAADAVQNHGKVA